VTVRLIESHGDAMTALYDCNERQQAVTADKDTS